MTIKEATVRIELSGSITEIRALETIYIDIPKGQILKQYEYTDEDGKKRLKIMITPYSKGR